MRTLLKIHAILLLFVCLLFPGSAFGTSSNAQTTQNPGAGSQITIDGLLATLNTDDEKTAFLQSVQWEKLPNDTSIEGLLYGLAVDDTGDNCVLTANNLYLFHQQECIAVYSLQTEGSYVVFSDDVNFYILFDRGHYILQFDAENNTVLYQMEIDEYTWKDWDRISSYRLAGNSPMVKNGNYILLDRNPNITPVISKTYDVKCENPLAIVLLEMQKRLIIKNLKKNNIIAFKTFSMLNLHKNSSSHRLCVHSMLSCLESQCFQ